MQSHRSRTTYAEPQKGVDSVLKGFKALRALYTIDTYAELSEGFKGVLVGILREYEIRDC